MNKNNSKSTTLFTIIIPFYNSSKYLYKSIESALFQSNIDKSMYEVIVVDDCSSDDSLNIANKFRLIENYFIYKTKVNSGPGIARNVGINNSIGEYILFLDSDDFLDLEALSKLKSHIYSNNKCDIIAYNWDYSKDSNLNKSRYKIGGRRDASFVISDDRVSNFLAMKVDRSVIYSAIKRKLITHHGLLFNYGYHEDIDFSLKALYFAKTVSYLNKKIYYKNNHTSSIINTITEKHIDGYVGSHKEIYHFLLSNGGVSKHFISFRSGLTGMLGNLVIVIRNLSRNKREADELYLKLHNVFNSNFPPKGLLVDIR